MKREWKPPFTVVYICNLCFNTFEFLDINARKRDDAPKKTWWLLHRFDANEVSPNIHICE